MGFVAESLWDSRRVISQCPSPQTEASWVSRTGNTQAPWCPFSLRLCPPGSDIKGRNEMGFAGADEETFHHELPRYTQSPNTPCHPFNPSAQPFQGCFVIGHLPMVAPRRCNHGLCGRIPLGFPEGDFPMPITAFGGSPPICGHLRHLWRTLPHSRALASIRGLSPPFGRRSWRSGLGASHPSPLEPHQRKPIHAKPVALSQSVKPSSPSPNSTQHPSTLLNITSPPTGHSWIARTSMLTSEAPGWSRTRHSWQHSAG